MLSPEKCKYSGAPKVLFVSAVQHSKEAGLYGFPTNSKGDGSRVGYRAGGGGLIPVPNRYLVPKRCLN